MLNYSFADIKNDRSIYTYMKNPHFDILVWSSLMLAQNYGIHKIIYMNNSVRLVVILLKGLLSQIYAHSTQTIT